MKSRKGEARIKRIGRKLKKRIDKLRRVMHANTTLRHNDNIHALENRGDNTLTDDNYAYLKQVVRVIPGWLEDYAAIRTMDLLDWQVSQGIKGPLFEIGVYAGRYFSLLIRSAVRNDDRVVGLDTFQWVEEDAVRHHLQPILLSGADVRFLKSPSTIYSAAELLAELGSRARFISIDGSHECDDVHWDLRLSEEMLAKCGIVAVDDFLNPLTLGVNEGVNKFFSTPRALVPFAYIANKLFLCRPTMAEAAMAKVEDLIVNDGIEERSRLWRENASQNRNRVVARMWGKPFVLVP